MGGEREKGLGTTTGVDLSADTARQDPQLTNRLGRFRIWALIVNLLTAPPPRAAVLGRRHSYRICCSTLSLPAVPHQPGSQHIFAPWECPPPSGRWNCALAVQRLPFLHCTHRTGMLAPASFPTSSFSESSAPSFQVLPLCLREQC